MSKTIFGRKIVGTNYYSVTVIRKLSTGNMVFHKYRKVSKNPVRLQRFFDAMKRPNMFDGRALYANLYDANTGTFSHRHTFD